MARKRVEGVESHTSDVAESWVRERPDLDPGGYLHLIYAMRLGRVLDRLYDRHTRDAYGISGADMRVLFALRRAGPPYSRRPTDLFRALLVTSGAITKQVDRLVKLGFVHRRPDPADGGGFLVGLTKTGIALAGRALDALADNSALLGGVSPLDAAERSMMIDLSRKMLTDLERAGTPDTDDDGG